MSAVSGNSPDFLDTNVLVYAYTKGDRRTERAEARLLSGGVVGIQGLNEFSHVALRKLKLDWNEIELALETIRAVCRPIVPLDLSVHARGIAIAARYRLSVYDGLMLAAAVGAGCTNFWSEDMQDGLVVDGTLTVRNPFPIV